MNEFLNDKIHIHSSVCRSVRCLVCTHTDSIYMRSSMYCKRSSQIGCMYSVELRPGKFQEFPYRNITTLQSNMNNMHKILFVTIVPKMKTVLSVTEPFLKFWTLVYPIILAQTQSSSYPYQCLSVILDGHVPNSVKINSRSNSETEAYH